MYAAIETAEDALATQGMFHLSPRSATGGNLSVSLMLIWQLWRDEIDMLVSSEPELAAVAMKELIHQSTTAVLPIQISVLAYSRTLVYKAYTRLHSIGKKG